MEKHPDMNCVFATLDAVMDSLYEIMGRSHDPKAIGREPMSNRDLLINQQGYAKGQHQAVADFAQTGLIPSKHDHAFQIRAAVWEIVSRVISSCIDASNVEDVDAMIAMMRTRVSALAAENKSTEWN